MIKSLLVMWLLAAAGAGLSQACSCHKRHPQEHFCSADFVVLAQVKRIVTDRSEWSRAYKVRIKKEFKVTAKGRVALSYGRILTPAHASTCGIRLKPGRRYLLTGNIRGGKPWINLCNWSQDWDRMTAIQRKGFRRLYQRGCDCKVVECHWWSKCPPPATSQAACTWSTASDWPLDCQQLHAICWRNAQGQCRWSQSRSLKECVRKNKKRKGASKSSTASSSISSSSISSSSISSSTTSSIGSPRWRSTHNNVLHA